MRTVIIAALSATLSCTVATVDAKPRKGRMVPAAPAAASAASPWAKFCGRERNINDDDGARVCFTGSVSRQSVTVAVIEPADGSRKVLRVTVPSPWQVESGMRVIVDQHAPMAGRVFTCYDGRCMADYVATPELVATLKTGRLLKVEVVNLAGDVATFPLLLSGVAQHSFREASKGAHATDPGIFKNRQKKLWAYAGTLPFPAVLRNAPSGSPCEEALWSRCAGGVFDRHGRRSETGDDRRSGWADETIR